MSAMRSVDTESVEEHRDSSQLVQIYTREALAQISYFRYILSIH